MKQLTISGNIGKDAVVRSTQSGDKVTGWTVAVEERNGQDKRTLWFDCTLWGKRGEALAQYLTKGSKVSVAGEFSTREHEGKTYLTLRVDAVTLMGGGQDRSEGQREERGGGYDRPPTGGARGTRDMDDEIPFKINGLL